MSHMVHLDLQVKDLQDKLSKRQQLVGEYAEKLRLLEVGGSFWNMF